jgi:polyvinyl alcohol dehydrogenase (cytochrome)
MIRLRMFAVAALMVTVGIVTAGGAPVTQKPVTPPATAQTPPTLEIPKEWAGRDPKAADTPGGRIYRENCSGCHDAGLDRAPQFIALQDMTPEAINRTLNEGVMREQGAALTAEQRIAVAEFVAGRKIGASSAAASLKMCTGPSANFDLDEPPVFTGWGLDAASTHAIPARTSGLSAGNVSRLKLKWAFAFPNSSRARSQPALAGGAILVGNHNGAVYALDRETGCVRWAFSAESEVRTGIIVSPWRKGDRTARPLVYFGDLAGNVYAVNLREGSLAWKVEADTHSAAIITGAPTLHDGKLYVPVASNEETFAASPAHACCTFRGSVVALDALTGSQKWRTWLVDPAVEQGTYKSGLPKLGPSGVAVWNSPSIDAKRGQLYIATGDNYSLPTTGLSDAVVALDLATGKIKWHHQVLGGDAWNFACVLKSSENCPDEASPDFDFGAGTVLAKAKDGRELVLAGQKSGGVYAFNPVDGALVWKQRIGRGGPAGGILFGMAAERGILFVPMSDRVAFGPDTFPPRPGLYALDIGSGKTVWGAPDTVNLCTKSPLCLAGYSGAVAVTGGLVLIGADDGHVRIYNSQTGRVLWQDNTARPFTAVNGIPAKGGSIGGGVAPLAYKGNLIVPSGYSYGLKTPGNVLLVYDVN